MLCQCQYWEVKPYEVLKVYTAKEHQCLITICKKCAHADDEKNNDSARTHSSMDDDTSENDSVHSKNSTYSTTSNESKYDSAHSTTEVVHDTHNADHPHKNKILIIKTQIERILANIWNRNMVASYFNTHGGITYRGLNVQLITFTPVHLFRLTFCDSFYNQSTDPDVIEAIATSPYAQHQTSNSTDHFTIYHDNEERSTEKDMTTHSKSNITDHTNGDIDTNSAEAIKITKLYSWHLTTPSHPHGLLETSLATLLAIRNTLEAIVHAPYVAYRLLLCDQQKYINHVTQHYTKYVRAWLQNLPSHQKNTTDLPDGRTLSEYLASSLEYCFTKYPMKIRLIYSKSLCTFAPFPQLSKKISIHDIVFYGKTLLIYQKNEQDTAFYGHNTTSWTLYVSQLSQRNVKTDCPSHLPNAKVQNSIANITQSIRSKNSCTMSNDGTLFLYQDLFSYAYYLSVKDGQQYKQCGVPILDNYDLCLAMSNECDQSFYICVHKYLAHAGYQLAHSGHQLAHSGHQLAHSGHQLAHAGHQLAHAGYQDDGQKNLCPPHQILIFQMKFSDKSITKQYFFPNIKRSCHPDISFNAYFNSTGNLLFIQSIVPASLSDVSDHFISVYEKKDHRWRAIVENIPYQPYTQERLKPDDWDSASIVDVSGHHFLINEKFKQPFRLGVINGLTLYKKINNIWKTCSLPYENHSEFRNAQANIQRVCFSRNGSKLTLLFEQQQPSSYKYDFCTWLMEDTQIDFIINDMVTYVKNIPCHFILNKEYPTLYSAHDKQFFICTAAADHISPTASMATIEKNHLGYETPVPRHVHQPIAFSHDRNIAITCENIEHQAMLTLHRKSNNTVQCYLDNFDKIPILYSISNMAIHGIKMWIFDRYFVCWGLRTTDQTPMVKIFSIAPIVNDPESTEIVKEITN